MIEAWVRDILRCPACGSMLADGVLADRKRPDEQELVCTGAACAMAFPVRDGIPVLLVDEGYPSTGTR